MFINGREVTASTFYYDGCHKIYLIEKPEEDIPKMESIGWNNDDIFEIEKLPEIWESSCELRFINTVQLESIVGQFDKAEFSV